MERGIAPVADMVSLLRLWLLLLRLRPDLTEFSTPKAGLLGTVAAMLCGFRGASTCCAASSWKPVLE